VKSQAKESISRRIAPEKRARIREYAERNRLSYSAAEEQLLDSGLAVDDPPLLRVSPEVETLFFGRSGSDEAPLGEAFTSEEELEREWQRWRERIEPPHTSWWAFWRVDKGLSAQEAGSRAEAARNARVTPQTGTSWVEWDAETGKSLIFAWFEDS
jgi:hypothetical protein